MKYLLGAMLGLFLFSCGSDDTSPGGKGSVEQIKLWTNAGLIEEMQQFGFTINEGDNPPNIEGTYRIKPRKLWGTNVDGDPELFTEYNERTITFSDQNNENLTIDFSGEEFDGGGNLVDSWTTNNHIANSYIIGSGIGFSAFFKINVTEGSSSYVLLKAFTGYVAGDGTGEFVIFREAEYMLDDNGDLNNMLIENYEGRLFSDGDDRVEKE
jgi:hypothetical protein